MTLKSLSSLAIASIFVLVAATVEARPGDDNRGGPGRGPGRGDDHRGDGRRGDDRGPRGPGRDDDYRGPGRPGHGGGPGHGGPGRPGPRPPMPPPPPPRPLPRPPAPPPHYPPNYGQVAIALPINQRMYNSTSIDLARFVDLRYYGGYRVVAVEVNARSIYNNSILDLFVNGYSNQSVYVSQYGQIYTLFPGNAVLGYGSLVLSNRGDVDVYGITLRLSR